MQPERRSLTPVVLLGLLVLVAGVAWFLLRPGAGDDARPAVDAEALGLPSMIGRERPDFRLPDRDGRERSAAEWDGRIVVVNFWATWCIPCRDEIPLLADLHERHGADGVTVVGIALDEPGAVDAFLTELGAGVGYPVLVAPGDAGIETAVAWGNAIGGLPYTVIVGRDRRIAFAQFGELTPMQAERALAPLL